MDWKLTKNADNEEKRLQLEGNRLNRPLCRQAFECIHREKISYEMKQIAN